MTSESGQVDECYVKRDLNLRKETYMCQKRPKIDQKKTYTYTRQKRPISTKRDLHVTSESCEADECHVKRDLNLRKENYSCQKRPKETYT